MGRWFTEFWGKNVNFSVIDEIAAPDMLLKYSLHAPRRGRDDIKAFMTDFRAAFPDLNFWGAADLIAEGDYVVGQWEGGGTHTGPAFKPPGPGQFGSVRLSAVEQAMAVFVCRPAIFIANHADLLVGQTVRLVGALGTPHARGIERACARVLDHAVFIGAGGHDCSVQRGELLRCQNLPALRIPVGRSDPRPDQAARGAQLLAGAPAMMPSKSAG